MSRALSHDESGHRILAVSVERHSEGQVTDFPFTAETSARAVIWKAESLA